MITKDDLKYNEDCYGGLKTNNKKIYKVKMQCNGCGFISSTENCPDNCGTMYKYKKLI